MDKGLKEEDATKFLKEQKKLEKTHKANVRASMIRM